MKGKLIVGTSPLTKISEVLDEIRGERILDVGCGAGIYGYLLRNKWQDTYPGRLQFNDFSNRDTTNDEPKLLVGCDIHLENLRRCRYHNIYDVLVAANASKLPFPSNYADTIICIEVLEHLEKNNALIAIESFKKIATQKIVITVPRNAVDPRTNNDEREFLKINSDDEDVKEWVEAERHKSNFTLKELKSLGFQIGGSVEDKTIMKNLLKRLRRTYRNHFGSNSQQILCTMKLDKKISAYNSEIPTPPILTEEFPDYR